MADTKKKTSFADKTNPVEIVGELGRNVGNEVKKLPPDLLREAFNQIGISQRPAKKPFSGEIVIGKSQTLEVNAHKESLEIRQFQTVKRTEQVIFDREQEVTKRRIDQLVLEIQKEAKSVSEQAAVLSTEVNEISVDASTKKPGEYYLNYFEWVMRLLRDLKTEVIKSRTWLQASQSKKAKKGYWAMFKKHGTSFGMSDERSIATSAG